MLQLNVDRLPEVLINKINSGVDKLENTPVDAPTYGPLLTNIKASMDFFIRLTYPKVREDINNKDSSQTTNKTKTQGE